MEHIAEEYLNDIFKRLKKIAKKALIIIPVTEKDGKECPDLYDDPTHINMKSDNYWKEYLGKYGSVEELPALTQELKKEYARICCSFLVRFF